MNKLQIKIQDSRKWGDGFCKRKKVEQEIRGKGDEGQTN